MEVLRNGNTMNEKFLKIIRESGISMYALAKRSGVPYTTVNELKNGKHNINQCSAETVCKLGIALDTDPLELLNPFRFLDGLEGKYKSIRFFWKSDQETSIHFEIDGKEVILGTGKLWNIPERRKYYDVIAEWMIQDFLNKREWEKQADRIYKKVRNNV